MRDLPDFHTITSEEALIRECLHMGWPLDQQSERAKVCHILSGIGPLPRLRDNSVDLYESLNRLRQQSWEHGTEIWERYVENRRQEVLALSHPQSITVRLQRTVVGTNGPVSRIRVPLPFEHPAQTNLSWQLVESSEVVEPIHTGVGYLDLKLSGRNPVASVTIDYGAALSPQTKGTHPSTSASQRLGISSPFPTPSVIQEKYHSLRTVAAPLERAHGLWTLFHSELLSGNVYHSKLGANEPSTSSTSTRWFDCVVASWNFAALAETINIPARVISGLILNRFGPSPHFWCEVLINDAWIPVDFYAWDLSQNDAPWRERFFGSLECRLRFECFPTIFSRFLPNVPWFIERESSQATAIYTYRRLDDRAALAQDRWHRLL